MTSAAVIGPWHVAATRLPRTPRTSPRFAAVAGVVVATGAGRAAARLAAAAQRQSARVRRAHLSSTGFGLLPTGSRPRPGCLGADAHRPHWSVGRGGGEDGDMGTPPMPGSIRVLVGYDGSPSSSNAVEIAAQLIPSASAFVPYLWQPPFTSSELSSRQMRQARTAEELADLLETEGRAEVERCRRRPGRAGHDSRHRGARPPGPCPGRHPTGLPRRGRGPVRQRGRRGGCRHQFRGRLRVHDRRDRPGGPRDRPPGAGPARDGARGPSAGPVSRPAATTTGGRGTT